MHLFQCPNRPWADRQWGLCIFDDVVEHCSPSSFKYAEYFLRPMLQSLCDSSPEVRQAAAYGVGVMAQYGGENYRPFCTGTVWDSYGCWQRLAFSRLLHDVFVSLFLSQRPFPCLSELSRQPTRAPRRMSMPQKTASLLLERSRGSGQSASTSMRSFLTGSAGSHSTRTKRRPSTRLTFCVTSLKGRTAAMSLSPADDASNLKQLFCPWQMNISPQQQPNCPRARQLQPS